MKLTPTGQIYYTLGIIGTTAIPILMYDSIFNINMVRFYTIPMISLNIWCIWTLIIMINNHE